LLVSLVVSVATARPPLDGRHSLGRVEGACCSSWTSPSAWVSLRWLLRDLQVSARQTISRGMWGPGALLTRCFSRRERPLIACIEQERFHVGYGAGVSIALAALWSTSRTNITLGAEFTRISAYAAWLARPATPMFLARPSGRAGQRAAVIVLKIS